LAKVESEAIMNQNLTKLNTRRLLSKSILTVLLQSVLLMVLLSLSACFTLPESGPVPTSVSSLQTPIPHATQIADRSLAATKQAFQQIVQQTVERARVESPTPEPTVFSPEPRSTPAGAGAIVSMIPLFYTHDFHFENSWYKDTEGGSARTFVYAGSVSGPGGEITQQGLVVVQVLKMSLKNNQRSMDVTYYKQFQTPSQSGSVHITGAVGERLILLSTNGTTFYFDVPARLFVPSLAWVSPVAIPSPRPVTPTP
jgi:hypothetical protein